MPGWASRAARMVSHVRVDYASMSHPAATPAPAPSSRPVLAVPPQTSATRPRTLALLALAAGARAGNGGEILERSGIGVQGHHPQRKERVGTDFADHQGSPWTEDLAQMGGSAGGVSPDLPPRLVSVLPSG